MHSCASRSPTLHLCISGPLNMPRSSSFELSAALEQRILAASSVLRLTPDAFIVRLLSQYYNTLGGLPHHLLRYIFTFLDYSTISSTLTRVCRLWQDCVCEDPQHFFFRLRQMHGIHLIDPVHGLFYFPRALKRVAMDSRAGASSSPSVAVAATASLSGISGGGTTAAASDADSRHHGPIPAVGSSATQQQDTNSAQVIPASSFLTVDIRTQNTKSLPWDYVREAVQWAIAGERVVHGEVRTPSLQKTEDPVWSQAATVAYDRRIYMFGGETYEGVVLAHAYEYDPMKRHWGVLPALCEKRAAASAVAYGGLIFVFGGYNTEKGVLDTYEVLDVETRTWISQTCSPQRFFQRQQQRKQKQQEAHTHADAAAAPETVQQDEWAAHENSNDHTRRTAWFSDATWPFSAAPQPMSAGSRGRSTVSSQYRMPEKVCGTAVTVHGDVLLLAGGHQSCIAPEQTAVSYSAVNSAATTPMSAMPVGVGGGTGTSTVSPAASTNSVNTPQHLPRVESIGAVAQPTAESFVWIFCPRTGRWCTQGPPLPSPRAFGAMTVLELPILGPCLCYFGGCAKADTPETAMLYIPLCAAAETRALGDANSRDCTDDAVITSLDAAASPSTGGEGSGVAKPPSATTTTNVTRRLLRRAAAVPKGAEDETGAQPQRGGAGARGEVRRSYRGARATPVAAVGSGAAVHTDPSDAEHSAAGAPPRAVTTDSEGRAFGSGRGDESAVLPCTDADTKMVWRCFRNPKELPWQQYVRIPIGGAFTSVAVLGAQHSLSLVLTGFYPAPNIGYCKVSHLLPLDAFLPLLGALSSPPPRARAEMKQHEPTSNDMMASRVRGNTPPPLASSPPPTETGSPPGAVKAAAAASSFPTLQLNPSLYGEFAQAMNHTHQEQEWNHHQRREIRDMVRSAAHAAMMRHPRNPQTAGEEHKWSLAPVPEVRVARLSRPSLLRVSWKVQTLNAKTIVGIE
ncbi:hypothetical protein, unknown function [Leishmania tarentolae]|uniref:F-box domain-containing protein n=1 Tax=Leishmania tarentolae TaxID=5689 RepID=A0A640KGW2_LEITA|nr:hypothetical protein, unknown function [Leishmania tarentolae]